MPNKYNLNDVVYILDNNLIYKGLIESVHIYKQAETNYTVSYYDEFGECQSSIFFKESLVYSSISELVDSLLREFYPREKDSYL